MAACSVDSNYPLLDGQGTRIRDIQFSSNFEAIEVLTLPGTSVECDVSINVRGYVGVKIVNNNLVFTTAINGLNTNISSSLDDHPNLSIKLSGGVLSIIGVDDITDGVAVPEMNVMFDSATGSLKFQI